MCVCMCVYTVHSRTHIHSHQVRVLNPVFFFYRMDLFQWGWLHNKFYKSKFYVPIDFQSKIRLNCQWEWFFFLHKLQIKSEKEYLKVISLGCVNCHSPSWKLKFLAHIFLSFPVFPAILQIELNRNCNYCFLSI